MIKVRLPWPPSINGYWRAVARTNKKTGKTTPGKILSKQGRAYKETAGGHLMEQGAAGKNLKGRLMVSIVAMPPDRRSRDLDNILKPLLDVLQEYRVIGNDDQIDAITVMRGARVKTGAISMIISILDPSAPELTLTTTYYRPTE